MEPNTKRKEKSVKKKNERKKTSLKKSIPITDIGFKGKIVNLRIK